MTTSVKTIAQGKGSQMKRRKKMMRISTVLLSAKPTFHSLIRGRGRILRAPPMLRLPMQVVRRLGRCLGRVHSSWCGRLTSYLVSSGKSDASYLHSLNYSSNWQRCSMLVWVMQEYSVYINRSIVKNILQ